VVRIFPAFLSLLKLDIFNYVRFNHQKSLHLPKNGSRSLFYTSVQERCQQEQEQEQQHQQQQLSVLILSVFVVVIKVKVVSEHNQ
jgi:hypothetical protein